MKNYLKVLLSFVLAFALIGPAFAQGVKAQELGEKEAKEIEELAEKLKFIFEEAAMKDESGNVVGINFKMIEAEYGKSPELEILKNQIKKDTLLKESNGKDFIVPNDPVLDRCLENKIKNGFKEVLSISTYITVIEWVKAGEYTLAAKKLISVGIKGNAVGISATLLYYMMSCLHEHKGWI